MYWNWYSLVFLFLVSKGYARTCEDDEHLCDYVKKIADKCGKPIERGIKKEEQDEIVRLHNEYRNKVALGKEKRPEDKGGQPSASNMMELKWDKDLAKRAQEWADQCTFKHDCNQCRHDKRFYVGQNLYMRSSRQPFEEYEKLMKKYYPDMKDRWEEAISAWYEEENKMDPEIVKAFNPTKLGEMIGHYTQLVWAKTNKIGCGYIEYQEGWYQHIHVCDYGPGGNYWDMPIYEEGKPCSLCPEGTKCSSKNKGLCTGS